MRSVPDAMDEALKPGKPLRVIEGNPHVGKSDEELFAEGRKQVAAERAKRPKIELDFSQRSGDRLLQSNEQKQLMEEMRQMDQRISVRKDGNKYIVSGDTFETYGDDLDDALMEHFNQLEDDLTVPDAPPTSPKSEYKPYQFPADESATMRPPPGERMAPHNRSVDAMRGAVSFNNHLSELDQMLAESGDYTPEAKQAIKKLHKTAQVAKSKIDVAANNSADNPGRALADIHQAMDVYKQTLGQYAKKLKGTGNWQNQEELRRLYEDLRQNLEDESIWGAVAGSRQKRVNAAQTRDFTNRGRYEKTVLTSDEAKRGADPFNELKEYDPKKVGSILQNAGRATNDVDERAMLEGLQSSKDLTRTFATEYGAPPKIEAATDNLEQRVNDLINSFDETRRNMTSARQMREVSQQAPWLGRAANLTAAGEDVISRNPALQKLETGARFIGQHGARTLPRFATQAVATLMASQESESRGHEKEAAVQKILKTNPQILGPFIQRLQQAAQEDKLGMELYKLEADPQWRDLQQQFRSE
jgi:hypothetical protein